jgi:hypothetical protein
MANVPTRQFFGTAQTVINSSSNIAAGNFSGAPAASFDNTTDAAVPYATHAQAMIEMPDWAAAPVAGTLIELWGVLLNTDGTDDDTDAPSGTSQGGAKQFGAWWVSAVDALQRRTITISLEGVNSQVDFYIKNGTAQQLTNTGVACVVKVTPFCYGVVA